MVAKFSILGLCLGLTSVVYGYLIDNHTLITYYHVAIKYDVNPPTLKQGYPISYNYGSETLGTVIFLKNDLSENLVKLNDTAYLAEPTIENAEVIYHFSGEKEENHTYLIIPDTNISYNQLIEFCDTLALRQYQSKFLLCSSNKKYYPLNVRNMNVFTTSEIGCLYYRSTLSIRMNNSAQLLVESEKTPMDSVSKITCKFYSNNLSGIKDNKCFRYTIQTAKKIKQEIELLDDAIANNPGDVFYQNLLNTELKKFDWAIKYAPYQLHLIGKNGFTIIDIYGNELKVTDYYNLIGQYAEGLACARSTLSEQFFNVSYTHLNSTHQFDKVLFIEYQMRDTYERLINKPLPPVILNIPKFL